MTTVETLRSVTRDPTAFIDSERLTQIIAALETELPAIDLQTRPSRARGESERAGKIQLAAALHRFVYMRSEYSDELDAGLNRPPKETLLSGGNCADQSLLLYALYREAGASARITAVEQVGGDSHHAFVECGFASTPDHVIDVLGEYYRSTGVISSGRFRFFEDGATTYLVADPVASRYLGDHTGLEKMGYIGPNGQMQVNRRFTLYGESD